MEDLIHCNFEIQQMKELEREAFVIWTMNFKYLCYNPRIRSWMS